MKTLRGPDAAVLCLLATGLTLAGTHMACGQPVMSYDQGTYQIETTPTELFLGRDAMGVPIPSGSFLYEGQLKPNPAFEIQWTLGLPAMASDVWMGRIVAQPGQVVTSVILQPTLTLFLQRFHSFNGNFLFEVFSDAAFTQLQYSDALPVSQATEGPGGIGVQFFTAQFPGGVNEVYVRYSQDLSGSAHPELGSGSFSSATVGLFELSATTAAAVPEPSIVLFAAAGGFLILIRRCSRR